MTKKALTKGQYARRVVTIDLMALLIFCIWAMVLNSFGIDASSTLDVIKTIGCCELIMLMGKKLYDKKRGEENE